MAKCSTCDARLGWAFPSALCVLIASPSSALASDPVPTKLGGIEAQGPATGSVTSVHHNPAVLSTLVGAQASANFTSGVETLSVQRFALADNGDVTDTLGDSATTFNPYASFFAGASFSLDPFAVGIGVYNTSARYQPYSSTVSRYHLAPDPDFGCAVDSDQNCPDLRSGGGLAVRTDYTISLARNLSDRVNVGSSIHFPRLRTRISEDRDSGIAAAGEACPVDDRKIEDSRCSERLVFQSKTVTGNRARDPSGPRINLALTFGLSFEVSPRFRLGIRYRTRPLLNKGNILSSGQAKVCLPYETTQKRAGELPSCDSAPSVEAVLEQRLPQELAVGTSNIFGQRDEWQVDTNIYWIDACAGGFELNKCNRQDEAHLSLTTLDNDALTLLPETPIYRGSQDSYGLEVYARYRRWRKAKSQTSAPNKRQPRSRVEYLFGADVRSPSVKPGAPTAARPEGWRVGARFGPSFERFRTSGSVYIVPGYAFGLTIPARVGPGGASPAFNPNSSTQYELDHADINSQWSDAVLTGRARPTNAGIYGASSHLLTVTIRWGERDPTSLR